MSHHHDDRALNAVARVRSVREQDSRLGLQQAVSHVRELTERVEEVRSDLETALQASPSGLASTGEFRSRQAGVDNLGRHLRELHDALAAAETVALEARERWSHDRSRLRAVEMLLEQRALARRRAAERVEARELDDIAARGWLRARRSVAQLRGGAA